MNNRKISLFFACIVGVAIGYLTAIFSSSAENSIELDQNKDGKPDLFFSYKNKSSAFAEKSESDDNFDGKIDSIIKFDPEGTAVSSKHDNDFNGTFETHLIYKNGIGDKSESDTNGDGKADVVIIFANGIPKETQIMNPETGKVVRISYFDSFFLKNADYDSNNDGVLDTRYTYDRYENIINTEPLNK